MKKLTIILASALLISSSAFAADAPALSWYGFVRTYSAHDSRECTAGTGDLYFYMPKDENIVNGKDLNEIPSFRALSLTSRIGLDIKGYEWEDYKISGKIEADFYSGINGVTGTAQFRLRQAYTTIARGDHSFKIGQAWTPMAADLPDIFSLESGAPFGMFSRSPQITYDYKLSEKTSFTASAIWQMQYTSTGPESASANYIKYSRIPELYAGLNYKKDGTILRLGGEVLHIKPRIYNADKTDFVSDHLTTWSVFQYGQFKSGNFTIKEKITYANDGSHANLVGGYGISEINPDGSFEYSATRNLTSWITIKYQKKDCKWVPSLFLGGSKLYGTPEEIVGAVYVKNSANKINHLYRIQPEVLYNMGRLQFGLEYMLTTVEYGTPNNHMLATDNLHKVSNHRIQSLVKFNF